MKTTLLFDFDGVILDSARIKEHGFRVILEDFDSELVDKLIDYHRANGGISRYAKLRYFYENLLNIPADENEIEKRATKFSFLMREQLTDPQYLIHDTLDFIKKRQNRFSFHVVSGADQQELIFLCETFAIKKYFVSILGSPTPKTVLIHDLLQGSGYSPQSCAMIGDSINDFTAARDNGVDFYGYNNPQLRNTGVGYIDLFANFEFPE